MICELIAFSGKAAPVVETEERIEALRDSSIKLFNL